MRERHTTERHVYVLAPSGRTAVPPDFLPGRTMALLRDANEMAARTPGMIVLPRAELSAEQMVAGLDAAADETHRGMWLPVIVAPDGGGTLRALPVSVGWPADPAQLARWAEGALDAEVFELRHVLTRVARARHDLNNPLTSAMAETQLALMDAPAGELKTGLETIAEQLRRMRDLIAGLKGLRGPL